MSFSAEKCLNLVQKTAITLIQVPQCVLLFFSINEGLPATNFSRSIDPSRADRGCSRANFPSKGNLIRLSKVSLFISLNSSHFLHFSAPDKPTKRKQADQQADKKHLNHVSQWRVEQ